MDKITVILTELKLVGITTRTNNSQVSVIDTQENKIADTLQKYFQNELSAKILSRRKAGTTFCVYTNYKNDVKGDYTYFIGEEVKDFENMQQSFETLVIPAQTYVKFTSSAGQMPAVCINMWQDIWKIEEVDLGVT